jgi:uncharacterized protein (TIGR02271 family)
MADMYGNLVSLDDGDWQVAEDEHDVRGWEVRTSDRRKIGSVDDLLADPTAMKVRFMTVDLDREVSSGERTIRVPIERARLQPDERAVVIDLAGDDINRYESASPRPWSDDDIRMTRAAEELRIGKRQVETGSVDVRKRVETERVRETVTLRGEDVDVQRRPVTGNTASHDVQITAQEVRVPIVEEEAIVEKRPVVKEEVIISKRPVERQETVEADVREERIEVDRERDPRTNERSKTRG